MEVTERYDFARLREVKVSVTISMGVLVSRLGVCFKRMKKNAFHKLDMARYVCFVIFEVEANICTLCEVIVKEKAWFRLQIEVQVCRGCRV
jgi:hypothetical protein